MPLVEIPGFRQYDSNTNARAINQIDLADVLNMVWSSFGPSTRDGSTLWKNDDQSNWGDIEVISIFAKRGDAFYYVVVILSSGRVFYIQSNDANFGTATATFTEIQSPSSSTPALAASASQYDAFGFNNLLYFADSTNQYFSWNGTDATLTSRTDPTNLGSNNIVKFVDKSNRLMALDDGGYTHLSAINDGTDFTSAGTGSLNYGRVEGLIATNIVSYQDDVLITTENTVAKKFQAYLITGIQFFDASVTGSDTSQFEVRKINSIAGILGKSAQEIQGDTIGLTPRGFIGLSKAIATTVEITNDRSFISYPIKEIVKEINFAQASSISSTVDPVKGRYYCAVPIGDDTTNANVILVYDFVNSSPAEDIYRWAVWSFQSISDIGTIQYVAGDLLVSDTDGNIFKVDDPDAANADYDGTNTAQAIIYNVKTSAIGGGNPGTEKDFGNINFLLTNLSADFDLDVNQIIDGRLVSEQVDGTPIKPIAVELPLGGLKYDTPGLLYDNFNYYDSAGSDQRPVSLVDRGGRAQSMQWQFYTNTTGVSWGLGNFSVNINIAEEANQAASNDDSI